MRICIQWRAAPRYIAIAIAILGYTYLIDQMLTLTLARQDEVSTADDAQQEQLLAPGEAR